MSVLVLGAGKMVEAILLGLRETQDLSEWLIYSPSGISASKLSQKVGARPILDLDEAKDPEWILVGCKPQQLQELKETLAGRFSDALYVSLLAAVTEEEQKRILGVSRMIRIMPNLAVEKNVGVCLLSSLSEEKEILSFEKLFSSLGLALVVNESEFEELTLLTGSGPAFFYEFSKSLAESFHSLDPENREKLARMVLLGAATSATHSERPLKEMIDAVTSKGGVTIAVLEAWRRLGIQKLFKEGIEAGKKRSAEIKAHFQK